jgi:pantothenate kinase
MWSHAGGDHNPTMLSPVDKLGSKIRFYLAETASLDEVLEWALANIFSEAEKKAATSGYILFPKNGF